MYSRNTNSDSCSEKLNQLPEKKCPVCSSNSIQPFLSRQKVPIQQNLIISDPKIATEIDLGDLTLAVCKNCGFIFNQSFDLNKIIYDTNYDNCQTHSSIFLNYVDQIVEYLREEKNLVHSNIIEIGCGQGFFLGKLVSNQEWGNQGYGFDPAYRGDNSYFDGKLQFKKCYYDQKQAHIKADVVICRHVIEHISKPRMLLKSIKKALINSPDARVFFETPCVNWILANKVIWDFFYEHCSYFNKQSLIEIFEIEGFVVDKVDHVFDGQYLWIEARLNQKPEPKKSELKRNNNDCNQLFSLIEEYCLHEKTMIREWKDLLAQLKLKGEVAIWGAGAKGITFANLIDPSRKKINCVIDINPNKQGKYVPKTGHPIHGYKEIRSRNIKSAIVMNPNYLSEIHQILQQENITLELVTNI